VPREDFEFLEMSHPKLAHEWDAEKNAPEQISNVRCDSGKKYWWSCDKGHSWQAPVTKRILGFANCHLCYKEAGLDLLGAYPILKAEFDSGKNGHIKIPISFSRGKFWWICPLGHSYHAAVSSRAKGSGCPYCSNQKVLAGFNDMATTHPELAKCLDPIKTGLTAAEVSGGSGVRFWWLCDKGHSTQATADSRKADPSRCPVCSNKQVVQGVNDMQTTHPQLAKEFDLTKNYPITPESINAGTHKVLWWLCPLGHSYDMDGMHRVTQNAKCPVCSSSRILAGFNDMATLAPQLVPHFHHEKNFPRTPQNLAYRSNLTLWWICEIGHEYKAKPGNRLQNGGLGCPVCSTHQILAGFNDLATTHPEIAKEWHPTKNHKTPKEVAGGTNKKAWWLCPEGHEWYAYINLRTRDRNCPRCSKGGFDNTKPGWFYLIENKEFRSRKVGISNHATKRLNEYESGWVLINTWADESGLKIRRLETLVLQFIRRDLGLPVHLANQEMGRAGGSSETFSDEGISAQDLINKISDIYQSLDED
jgi:ribosomal protein S27AE